MKFIKLTKRDGDTVYINMALIVTISRDNENGLTFIRDTAPLISDVDDFLIVKETPDEILMRMGNC